jgi:hypothetical protein
VYAALICAALGIAWVSRLDKDAGGYRDSFQTPDKREHAAIAAVLMAGALLMCVPLWPAAGLTIAAGIGWELVQAFPRGAPRGFASWRDVVADTAGVAVTTVVALALGVR